MAGGSASVGGGTTQGEGNQKNTYIGEDSHNRPLQDMMRWLTQQLGQSQTMKNLLMGGKNYGIGGLKPTDYFNMPGVAHVPPPSDAPNHRDQQWETLPDGTRHPVKSRSLMGQGYWTKDPTTGENKNWISTGGSSVAGGQGGQPVVRGDGRGGTVGGGSTPTGGGGVGPGGSTSGGGGSQPHPVFGDTGNGTPVVPGGTPTGGGPTGGGGGPIPRDPVGVGPRGAAAPPNLSSLYGATQAQQPNASGMMPAIPGGGAAPAGTIGSIAENPHGKDNRDYDITGGGITNGGVSGSGGNVPGGFGDQTEASATTNGDQTDYQDFGLGPEFTAGSGEAAPDGGLYGLWNGMVENGGYDADTMNSINQRGMEGARGAFDTARSDMGRQRAMTGNSAGYGAASAKLAADQSKVMGNQALDNQFKFANEKQRQKELGGQGLQGLMGMQNTDEQGMMAKLMDILTTKREGYTDSKSSNILGSLGIGS